MNFINGFIIKKAIISVQLLLNINRIYYRLKTNYINLELIFVRTYLLFIYKFK